MKQITASVETYRSFGSLVNIKSFKYYHILMMFLSIHLTYRQLVCQ